MNPTQQVQKAKLQYYEDQPKQRPGRDSSARNDIRNALDSQVGDNPPPFRLIGCCYFSASVPIAPVFIPVLGVSSGSAILSWSYAGTDETGFNIERSLTGLNYGNIFVLANSSSRSYTDVNVSAPNTYYYRIDAFNSVGPGPYSNTASITFSSPPQAAPIITNLYSGSAILSWSYALNDENGFIIQRAPDGIAYANLVILSSSVSRSYIDNTVSTPNTYYYRLDAFNSVGTGPFSNTASITFTASVGPTSSACVAPWFNNYTQSFESLPFDISSGVTQSYTQSLTGQRVSLWGRAIQAVDINIINIKQPDGTYFNGNNNFGNNANLDDVDGWNPPEDGYLYDNAALSFYAIQSGTYQIGLGNWSGEEGFGFIDSGSMSLYVSPAPEYKASWAGANPGNIYYISSSQMVGVAQNYGGSGPSGWAIWYNVTASAINKKAEFPNGLFGGTYSPTQDRVFILTSDTNTTNSVYEYSSIGNLITSYSLDAQIHAPRFGFVGFKGMCYDDFNDRLFMIQENANNPSYVVWSCASRNAVHSGSLPGFFSPASAFPTYVDVNNRYYIGSGPTSPMFWVDATTYVSGATATLAGNAIQYEPVTQVIGGDNHTNVNLQPGGIAIIDPISDRIILQATSRSVAFGSPGGNFSGIAFDPCTQTVVLDWDQQTGITSIPVMAASRSFSASNFLPVCGPNDVNPNGSQSFNASWGMVYAPVDTKMYMVGVFFDAGNNLSCSLWSSKITANLVQPTQPPFSIALSATGTFDFTVTSVPTLEASVPLGHGIGGSLSGFSVNTSIDRAMVSGYTGSVGRSFFIIPSTMTITGSTISRSFGQVTEPTVVATSGSSFYFVDTFIGSQNTIIQVDGNGNFIASSNVDPISSSNFFSIAQLGGKLWIPHRGGPANVNSWVSILNPNTLAVEAEYQLAATNFSATILAHAFEDKTRGYSYVYYNNISGSGNNSLSVFTASTSPITSSRVGDLRFTGSADWENGFVYIPATGKVYVSAFGGSPYQIWEVSPTSLHVDYIYDMAAIFGNGNIRPKYLDYNSTTNIMQFTHNSVLYGFNPMTRTFVFSCSLDANNHVSTTIISNNPGTGELYALSASTGGVITTGSLLKFSAPVESVFSKSIINWSASSMTNITYFQLQKSLDSHSWSNLVVTIPPTETYTDLNITGSVSGSTYWYRVNGVELLMSTSSFSNTASLTFFTQAIVPQSLCVTPPFQSLVLSGSIQAPLTTSLISQ